MKTNTLSAKIDEAIFLLTEIQAEFVYHVEREDNYRAARQAMRGYSLLEVGVEGCQRMQDYLASLTDWQQAELHEAFLDD